jgi:hypothetical protein
MATATRALLPGHSGRVALGQFQGPLKVVFDLGEGVLSKRLEVRVCAVLDLVSEKRSIAFLIADLTLDIVTVQGEATPVSALSEPIIVS